MQIGFPTHRVSVEMKALIGREWDSENWNGDIWENSDEVEALNSHILLSLLC